MRCGLCERDVEKFVGSHIIPKAMMIDGLNDGERIAVAGTAGHPRKSLTGIWSKIVCLDCEKSFGPDDEYLIQVYRRLDSFPEGFEGHATILENVDGLLLQRSILSVLFRAHLSDHVAFRSIDLEEHADELRKFLLSQKKEAPASFSICLRHLTSPTGELVIQPIREEYNGINIFRFFFPKITALIRVDNREMEEPFRIISLGANKPAHAMRSKNFSPSEMNIIRRIINHNADTLPGTFGTKISD